MERTKTIRVSGDQFSKFIEMFSKLQAKASKYGVEFKEEHELIKGDFVVKLYFKESLIQYKDKEGNTFDFVALLVRDMGNPANPVNIVIPSRNCLSEDFTAYFSDEKCRFGEKHNWRCDHCGYARRRYSVYVFRSASGEEKMIATACAKEYFGISISNALAGIERACRAIEKIAKKAHEQTLLPPVDLKVAVEQIYQPYRRSNFYGGIFSREWKTMKTAKLVLLRSEGTFKHSWTLPERPLLLEELKDYWKKEEAKNPSDTLKHNIAASFGYNRPIMAFVVYAVLCYIRDMIIPLTRPAPAPEPEPEPEPEAPPPPSPPAPPAAKGFLGVEGNTIDVDCAYTGSFEYRSRFHAGTDFCHKFSDSQGNVITTFSPRAVALPKGAAVNLKGNVKSHSTYKGEKSTIITRSQITSK